MTQSEIENMLIGIVCELQTLSGREEVNVDKDTCPLDDMPGFDSLNGVEATIELASKLGVTIDLNDVFVEEGKALTIGEAVVRVLKVMKVDK